MLTIQEHEVEAQLASLLDRVQQGEGSWIMRRGEPVARLLPPEERSKPDLTGDDIVEKFREARKGVRLNSLSIKSMINEGRR